MSIESELRLVSKEVVDIAATHKGKIPKAIAERNIILWLKKDIKLIADVNRPKQLLEYLESLDKV